MNSQNNKSKTRISDFIREYCESSVKREALIRSYRCVADRIDEFEKHIGKIIYTDSFTEQIAEEYAHFLRSYVMQTNKSYKQSTIRNYIQRTVAMLNKAERQGYIVDKSGFNTVSVVKDDINSVYLNLEELGRIDRLNLQHVTERRIRDIFLIGCYTGLRFSDYSRLSEDNFTNGNICILTKKTKAKAIIPVHPVIQSIIERNGGYGFLGYANSLFYFNKAVKRICRKAGINNNVTVECLRGGESVKSTYRKYELVSSHTARRTAATNMYLAGIPPFRIMLITGHKTESSFYRYIRIRKEENAAELRKYAFFGS